MRNGIAGADRERHEHGSSLGARRASALVLGVALLFASSSSALAADTDGDGVDDLIDNCLLMPNGPDEMSNQVDTDMDGFGNACDADFDQNGVVSFSDSPCLPLDAPLVGAALVKDLDGDEVCTINDAAIVFFYQVTGGPGP